MEGLEGDGLLRSVVSDRVGDGVDDVGVGHALCDGRLQGRAIPHDDSTQIIDYLCVAQIAQASKEIRA